MSVINQQRLVDFEVVAVPASGLTTFSVLACPDTAAVSDRLATALRDARATVASQRVFGDIGAWRFDGAPAWPVTWLTGNGRTSTRPPGSQITAVSGAEVKPLELDGRVIGSLFEDDCAEYCVLGDILPTDLSATDALQARSVLERIEQAIGLAGMDLRHIVRTWFFINDILDWYGDFNAVRNRFFTERGMFERFLPASTGVGTGNAAGAALVADVLAMKPKDGRLSVREARSPLQCPATQYRSSFSRAVEVCAPGYRKLYVSGTASISANGESAHRGDVPRQVALAMKVAEGILNGCGMDWSHVVRGTAYFKNLEHAPVFYNYLQERQLPSLPVIAAGADICRDDLLFEIELDAAVEAP
ncbi:MAG: hypothetical protein IT168_02365 [Bryobacterales bacterium]|nr:hypothetical protein [Bryobacterales bacterium]